MKLFIADKRAEMLRAQVCEEERLKAEQTVRAAAVAVAGKACKVVEEFVARNVRMSRRVAGLRASVEVRLTCSCGDEDVRLINAKCEGAFFTRDPPGRTGQLCAHRCFPGWVCFGSVGKMLPRLSSPLFSKAVIAGRSLTLPAEDT